MSPLILCLLILALTSPLLWIIQPHRFRHIGWLAMLPPAGVTVWLLFQMPAIATGQVYTARYSWASALNLDLALRLDGLALFFGLIVVGVGAAVALYTGYYLEGDPRQGFFYGQIFLFMTSMLGLVWSDNLLALFVFWEGTSITSYLLIAFKDTDKAAQDGGRRAFLVTGVGGLAMLFGLVMLGSGVGTYTISEIVISPGVTAIPYFPIALSLICLGAFTKSAQFPFHFWLPGAMSAPTPASAYLHSATMVKAGIFLLARLHPGLSDHPLWFWLLFSFGAATMLVGAVGAFGHYDIKALLAYATVSQLGILVMLLAFNTKEAYIAAVVGILAHALYKGPLFLVAGIVDHATGTRDLRELARLYRELPLVTGVAVLAGVSMAGLPPTFGFLAKETLLETFHHTAEAASPVIGWGGLVAAAAGGALFVGYTATLLWEGFFDRAHGEHAAHVHHAPAFSFVAPPLVLTLIGTAIPFLLIQIEGFLFSPPVTSVAGEVVDVHLALWHGFNTVFITSMIAIATGLLIFWQRAILRGWLLAWPASVNGVKLFDKIIYSAYDLARWTTRWVQGGTLASQASVTMLAAVAVMVYALLALNWTTDLPLYWSNTPRVAELILVAVAIAASVITVRARMRLSAIISVGVVGIAITLFFIFHSAPDLALTQLLVDILTVVLLVLVFYRIPPRSLPPISRIAQARNTFVAGAVGLVGFFLVLITTGEPFFQPISSYFLLNAVPLGHGGNIVNVILVDFRAFDTLGEITVLGIAAVGGYAVMRAERLRLRRFTEPQPPTEDSVDADTHTPESAAHD